MTATESEQRAEHHAKEAERLLAGRLGLITNYVKAGAHASLALYYSGQSRKPSVTPNDAPASYSATEASR